MHSRSARGWRRLCSLRRWPRVSGKSRPFASSCDLSAPRGLTAGREMALNNHTTLFLNYLISVFQRSDQRCVYQATSPASAASPSSRTRSRTTCLPLPTVAPLLGVNASRWRGRAKWTSLVASSGGIGPARPWAAACPSGEPSAARAAAVATGGMSFDDAPAPAPGDRDHAPGDLVPVLGGAAHGPVPALARALARALGGLGGRGGHARQDPVRDPAPGTVATGSTGHRGTVGGATPGHGPARVATVLARLQQ